MAASGQVSVIRNPLKTTTVGIYRGWQEELIQLQRRWNELKANAQEQGDSSEEAEGLRLRLQGLRDLIAEAVVVEGEPDEWRTEMPTVRLGSKVKVLFSDGGEDEFLFVGLAGPSAEANVLTPRTPLGAAILGRRVGEEITYRVGRAEYKATVLRCLVPARAVNVGKVTVLEGRDELDEAERVAAEVSVFLRDGVPAEEIAVAWRAPYQGWPFETVFARRGIRYHLAEHGGFLDQPPVAGIMALLRLLDAPADGRALFTAMRAFTHAPAESLERLAASWTGPETALAVSLAKDKAVTGLLQAMYKVWPRADGLTPEKALGELRDRLERLRPDFFGDLYTAPWPAVINAARIHQTIHGFLSEADKIAGASRRAAREGGVTLTPLPLLGEHAFTVLFLVGANEGALPLLRDGHDDLPGERELFYGALAAAKTALLSWSRNAGGRPAKPSRFLAEVPEEPARRAGAERRVRRTKGK